MALKLTLAVVLLAAVCYGQQLGDNYVDDYYNDGGVEQQQRPAPRPQAHRQQQQLAPVRSNAVVRPTPVPILKQINRHNEDGSYTYGYEGADGTFKIETKFPTGDVKGKYGFVDDTGKVRVVEYGADRYGFQPAGEGITVAPPTLVDETTEEEPLPPRAFKSRPAARPPPPVQYREVEEEVVHHRPPPPPPQRSQGPAPPRALSIPGAAPAPAQRPAAFAPAHSQSFAPPPPRPKAFQPAPQPQQHFGPQQFASGAAHQGPRVAPPPQQAPRYQPQPQQAPRYQQQQQQAPQRPSGGILDRLAKDYALPAGAGAPLHDISFGYY
ncbi:synapsin-1-like [Hetaerina americana]|uniref:synapsin-1-like n=1 Tax=Hetaerina americana TaxID=62018 RepID=UPI003A7F3134